MLNERCLEGGGGGKDYLTRGTIKIELMANRALRATQCNGKRANLFTTTVTVTIYSGVLKLPGRELA